MTSNLGGPPKSLFNGPFSASLLYFVISVQLEVNRRSINNWLMTGFNLGHLVSKATFLSAVPLALLLLSLL